MDPESKKLLEKTLKLAEENNNILRALHRSMRVRRFMSVVYWVIVVGSAIGAYYFIQPFIDQIIGTYGGVKSNFESVNSLIQNFRDSQSF